MVIRSALFTTSKTSLARYRSLSSASASAMADHYDLIVLGCGSGGVRASRLAASLGKKGTALAPLSTAPAPCRARTDPSLQWR